VEPQTRERQDGFKPSLPVSTPDNEAGKICKCRCIDEWKLLAHALGKIVTTISENELKQNEELRDALVDLSGTALKWRQEALKTGITASELQLTEKAFSKITQFVSKWDLDKTLKSKYDLDIELNPVVE
jgi:hypothetical protein